MLPWRVFEFLVLKDGEVIADDLPSVLRVNDVVHESSLRRNEGVREPSGVLLGVLLDVLTPENYLDGTLCAHDGDLTPRPRVVAVPAKVLGGHDVVSSPVSLAGDYGDLWNSGLGVGEEELGGMGMGG